jgi:hypothetical protein
MEDFTIDTPVKLVGESITAKFPQGSLQIRMGALLDRHAVMHAEVI